MTIGTQKKRFQLALRCFRWVVYFIGGLYMIMELQSLKFKRPQVTLTTELPLWDLYSESKDKTLSELGFS